jgi:hypothetical protein
MLLSISIDDQAVSDDIDPLLPAHATLVVQTVGRAHDAVALADDTEATFVDAIETRIVRVELIAFAIFVLPTL